MREGAFKKYGKKTLMYAFLIIMSFISVFPLYWCFISAFNTTQEILGGKLIPGSHLIENIQNLLEQQQVFTALKNSFINTILVVVLSLSCCSIAGYGFEIYHDKAKDTVMGVLMLSMMVPFVAIMVPMFQMFSSMGLLNKYIGFVLPSISTPFLIMLFRNNARTFPREIIEAARMDGLNELQIFVRIFVPTMRPTYAAAATITFMNSWNSFMWPRIIFKTNESVTMPMMVSNMMNGYVLDYGVIMAAVTICTLPTVIIFFLLQKSFTEAIAGSVK
ncbi:MAG: carbohydrate ABC transporter permease [Clostridia bacterium]|nr:carbohydrate ABC transporter permease [Clostridia bacterium]